MNAKLPLFHKGEIGNMHFGQRVQAQTNTMMYIFFAAVIIFFFILASRLFQLTVVKGNYYRSLSEDNRIREVVIEAKRGQIVDRRGYVIAENSDAELREGAIRINSKRYYKSPEAYAHLLGYRQIADERDIENDTCINKVRLGDKVGKKGIERLFDCELRGKNGKKLVEVNAQGELERTLTVVPPEDGSTVQLAIDSDLQQRAFQLLQGKKGSVVVVNPKTGEILALTSNPSFNPQVFEDNDAEKVSALFQDEDRPLFNRSTEGTYPPGSVFKMVMIAAGLEEEAVTKSDTVEDTGTVELGDREFGTWAYLEQGRTEGEIDAVKSLQRSNDIYYYKLSEKLGPEKMKKWSEIFGYQNLSGIGIEEAMGTIPSPFWKQDTLKEQWYTGDSYNFSIGQGYVLATPLQVALATVPFANGGEYCKPMVVKNGSEFAVQPDCKPLPMSDETIATVREGMHQACKPGGTGWPLFNFKVRDPKAPTPTTAVASGSAGIATGSAALAQISRIPEPTSMPIEELWDPNFLAASSSAYLRGYTTKEVDAACKTGTAESGGNNKPHAWFTAFAPYNDPEILVTVMLENAGQGSDMAAPVAREILRMYFERQQ